MAKALCAAVIEFCSRTRTGGTLKEIHLVDIDSKQTNETNRRFKRSPSFHHITDKPLSRGASGRANASPSQTQSMPTGPYTSGDGDEDGTRARSNSMEAKKQTGSRSAGSEKKDICPICFDSLVAKPKKCLPKCGHDFCKKCIDQAFKTKNACPVCSTLYGEITGNQPANGTMRDRVMAYTHLRGYGKCGTIAIDYNLPSGVQTVGIFIHLFT